MLSKQPSVPHDEPDVNPLAGENPYLAYSKRIASQSVNDNDPDEAEWLTPTEMRQRLAANGYSPIPVNGKAAKLTGWPNALNPGPTVIASWAKDRKGETNTGLITKFTPAFDIDIKNKEAAEAVEGLVRKRFGHQGHFMTRTGHAPKRLIPFRTDEPFAKIAVGFQTGDKIEFLGDGQMFVALGVHPDTRRPYTWRRGIPSSVPRASLPAITEAEARELVEEAVALLIAKYGYKLPNGKDGDDNPFTKHADAQRPRIDVDALLAEMGDGNVHDTQVSVTAALMIAGCEEDDAVERVLAATKKAAGNKKWDWGAEEKAIRKMCRDAAEKVASGELGVKTDPKRRAGEGVSLYDFYAYMPTHSYIFVPSREMWPSASVNARISPIPIGDDEKIPAHVWLDQNRHIEQMTWAPGAPELIIDRLIVNGGWIERKGVSCFNLYLPPAASPGDAAKATPWVDHVRKVFGDDDAGHILNWFAHRVQRPGEKINHGLLLGGEQGVGKDTMLEPVKRAVGSWNFGEVSPQKMLGRFNGFFKSVILRVSEARDLGDSDRFAFYDHMKAYMAAPPDVLLVDEKHIREHYVVNCVGVVITSNHKTDGVFLPADDRRHFVAWTDLKKESFPPEYWNGLWRWYEKEGGYGHVAAYLAALDISGFDPKAPPPKTPAFWAIVDASRAPEEAELESVIEALGSPDALTLSDLIDTSAKDNANYQIYQWLEDRKNRRSIPYKLERCGYVSIRNDTAESGLWKIEGKKQVIYAKSALSIADRIKAARGRVGH
jgi:hypothetical protein